MAHKAVHRRHERLCCQAELHLACQGILQINGCIELSLAWGGAHAADAIASLGDHALLQGKYPGVRHQWILSPLGQQNVQAQLVVGGERFSDRGGYLLDQRIANGICLASGALLQLGKGQHPHPQHQQRQWQHRQHEQFACQLHAVLAPGSIAAQKQIFGGGWCRVQVETQSV